jgi:hypothetical protein
VVRGCRLKSLRGYCWACGNVVERQATIRRLVKSGAMAAMRRAMESCPDNGRTKPESLRLMLPEHELARELLVSMANGERDVATNGDLVVARPRGGRGSALASGSGVPWNVVPVGLRYSGKW